MTEHKLFTGDIPEVSTAGFHEHRERAPHLEQPAHQQRLRRAAKFVIAATNDLIGRNQYRGVGVSDLGCGDGGLLQLLTPLAGVTAWGYDFQPSNQAGWRERGVTAELLDVFTPTGLNCRAVVGNIAVTTEVLEHLADPHGTVRRIREAGALWLVASSPWNEHPGSHDACHAWAWDTDGYAALLTQGGWQIERHETVDQFQVVLAHARGDA
jgi:hypothetical protein